MGKETKKQEMIEKIKIRKNEGKIVRRIVSIVTLVVLSLVFIIGISGYFYVKSALKPLDPDSTKEIKVDIPIGSSLDSIATILETKGVIKNARIFKYYTKFKNESEFQAGNYQLTKSMTPDEIIQSLKTGKVYRKPEFTITIPEGLNLEQISKIIEKKTEYTSDEFMEKINNQEFIKNIMGTYPDLITKEVMNDNIRYDLEGYLYPATYSFYDKNTSLEDIIKMMIGQTDKVISEYRPLLEEKQLTVHQLLTFASLLEEEATAQTDRETIASVFYNRLDEKMPLQTDPTVLYALGSHKEKVLFEDLEVINPYNTYVNTGLPPGPISNAGKVSIEAALNPSKTEYLYFLADKTGVNHFAKTYDEHQKNIKEYLR